MTNKEQLEQIEMCLKVLEYGKIKFNVGRIDQLEPPAVYDRQNFYPLYEAVQSVMDAGHFTWHIKSKLGEMREELLKEESEDIKEPEIDELTELYEAFAATDLPLLLADSQKTALLYVLRDRIKQLKQLQEETNND
jgi:hypothetical protein